MGYFCFSKRLFQLICFLLLAIVFQFFFFHDITFCASEIVEALGASGSGGDDPNERLPVNVGGAVNGEDFLEWLLRVLNQNRLALSHVIGDNGTAVVFCAGGAFIVVIAGVGIVTGSVLVLDRVGEHLFNQGFYTTLANIEQSSTNVAAASTKAGDAIANTASSIQTVTSQLSTAVHLLEQQDGFVIGCTIGATVAVVILRPSVLFRLAR